MGGAKALWAPLKSTTADAFYHIMGNLFIKLNINSLLIFPILRFNLLTPYT